MSGSLGRDGSIIPYYQGENKGDSEIGGIKRRILVHHALSTNRQIGRNRQFLYVHIANLRTATLMPSLASYQSTEISIRGMGSVSASTNYDILRIAKAGLSAGYFPQYHANMSSME